MTTSLDVAPQTEPSSLSPPRFAHPSEGEFARLLDFYGVRWHYEPRSFPLRFDDAGQMIEAFTPDFYLPDYDAYIELTTLRQSLITYKNRKLRMMRERFPDVNIRLINKRDYLKLLDRFGVDPRGAAELPKIDRILFSEQEIAARVEELGREITRAYAGRDLILVGVLRGVIPFMGDLLRRIALPVRADYLSLSPYQRDDTPLSFTRALEEDVSGADVLVVEDIVDTGMSLHRLLSYVRAHGPVSVEVCTLLDKRARRLVDAPIRFAGFSIGDEFVVGYGLDYRKRYRNLPFIATLEQLHHSS